MELPVKFNNPLFGHFNSKFSIKQDRYLEYILNEPFINEVYDVFIRALTVLEKEEPNNGIRFSLDGEKSDQKFLNDAFAICAACWVRPDPHNMLGSPYEVYNGDPYRQYYNDAVSCIAYAILSHQTALPEVAKRLMMAISLRADGDVYFWPLFKEFCDRKKAEGDYDDFNFMQILTYKPVILLPWDNGMEDLERDMNNTSDALTCTQCFISC